MPQVILIIVQIWETLVRQQCYLPGSTNELHVVLNSEFLRKITCTVLLF